MLERLILLWARSDEFNDVGHQKILEEDVDVAYQESSIDQRSETEQDEDNQDKVKGERDLNFW